MKKWILLIGLLTYSSVGWSKTLMMECFDSSDTQKIKGQIWKMETDEPSNSPKLLMHRWKGNWDDKCKYFECTKGDWSVNSIGGVSPEMIKNLGELLSPQDRDPYHIEQTFDFRILRVDVVKWSWDRKEILVSSKLKCERIE